uniref:non-specific serine/threonine protein kinase n=1 Tax=Manihot esculenta TaxID=3983 RepID=A0A2C9VLJ5_MANES
MACLRNCFRNADRLTDSETRERFGPKKYTFRELANATGHFSNSNSLGEGGFGQVYKGILDGKEVAIKKLKYLPNEQPSEGLLQEIKIVSSVIHKNLVKLLGYCIEGDDILLVLEYFPQKSLNFHLHGNKILEWKPRMKIAKGSAEALAYLHGGCKPKIIHRDVTSSNILLDDDLEAKVTDFGLALFFPETGNLTHISRSNKGTDVYADPDPQNYPSRKVSERSDVYSYGVVLLELITGRKTKFEGVDIVTWAKPRIEYALSSGDYSKLVDSKLQKNYVEEELKTMISCTAACLYKPSKSRPLMKQIVRALESCKDIEDIWDEKNDNQFLTNDPMPNGTYNINNFQHMLPKPLVISEASNGIEFTQQEGLYNASNGTERFQAYFRKGYRLRKFSYQLLTEATGGFSEDNRLDEGPLGQVYMGTLNGEKVAIKKFNNPRKHEEEYKHMKAIGSDFHHRNLVNLIGYCEERANRLLVYEFVPHYRSVRCFLKGMPLTNFKAFITWE